MSNNPLVVIGDRSFTAEELFPLVIQYGLFPQLAREIIIDRAIRDVACTPEEEELARGQFYQKNGLVTKEQLEVWLKTNGLTPEQLERVILRDIKLEKYKEKTWENKIESHFLEIRQQLDRVVYSLIRVQDAGLAHELFFQIQEGEKTFAELARTYSKGIEAQSDGMIGPVELSVPHPRIAAMLASSQPGQLWPPLQIENWIVIVRLEQYLASELTPPVRQKVLDDLFQQWLNSEMQKIKFPNLTETSGADLTSRSESLP